jgi:putative methyltransferase (TIGR04325 family)
MNYRRILKDFIPPILFDSLRKIKFLNRQNFDVSQSYPLTNTAQTYANYQSALAACEGFRDYQDSDLVRIVLAKTHVLREELQKFPLHLPRQVEQNLLGVNFALIKLKLDRPVNVIDVGGAMGAHYYWARALLPKTVQLNWYVVETQAMVRAASAVVNDELHFCDNLESALDTLGEVDLIHSSGTLQCVPEPRRLLRDMIESQASYLLLSRLGLTAGPHDVVVVHQSRLSDNGPGPLPPGFQDGLCRYPMTYVRQSDFDLLIHEHYRPVFTVDDESGITLVSNEPLYGFGCLYERK